jgi:hypothetical protein
MRAISTLVLLILSLPLCTLASEAPSTSAAFAEAWVQHKRPTPTPTPTPTPPPDGPNPMDPGGPGVRLAGIEPVLTSVQKKPTPTPTPPPDGPDPGNIGGPGRIVLEPGIVPSVNYNYRPARPARRRSRGSFGAILGRGAGTSIRLNPPVPCDREDQEEEDLSGTYLGNVEYPHGGLSGFATLQIEGRAFTLVMNGQQLKGQLAAETTCNYTAVAMRFANATDPSSETSFPSTLSLQARRSGADLRLSSVRGEKEFRFTPASSKRKRL